MKVLIVSIAGKFWDSAVSVAFAAAIVAVLLVSVVFWTVTARMAIAFLTHLCTGYPATAGAIAVGFTILCLFAGISWMLFRILRKLMAKFRFRVDTAQRSAGS